MNGYLRSGQLSVDAIPPISGKITLIDNAVRHTPYIRQFYVPEFRLDKMADTGELFSMNPVHAIQPLNHPDPGFLCTFHSIQALCRSDQKDRGNSRVARVVCNCNSALLQYRDHGGLKGSRAAQTKLMRQDADAFLFEVHVYSIQKVILLYSEYSIMA